MCTETWRKWTRPPGRRPRTNRNLITFLLRKWTRPPGRRPRKNRNLIIFLLRKWTRPPGRRPRTNRNLIIFLLSKWTRPPGRRPRTKFVRGLLPAGLVHFLHSMMPWKLDLSHKSFQFGSNFEKRCQITLLSTIHLKRRCSGEWFSTFFWRFEP